MKLDTKSTVMIVVLAVVVMGLSWFLLGKFGVLVQPSSVYEPPEGLRFPYKPFTESYYTPEDNLQTFPLGESQEFDEVYDLKKLSIEGGAIKTIPSEIGQFNSLVVLVVRDSALESIAAEIGSLVNLEFLDLAGNDLKSLPTEISQLLKLRELYLTDNPIGPEERARIQELLPDTEISF